MNTCVCSIEDKNEERALTLPDERHTFILMHIEIGHLLIDILNRLHQRLFTLM